MDISAGASAEVSSIGIPLKLELQGYGEPRDTNLNSGPV